MAVNLIGPRIVTGVISETNYTVDLPEKRDKANLKCKFVELLLQAPCICYSAN